MTRPFRSRSEETPSRRLACSEATTHYPFFHPAPPHQRHEQVLNPQSTLNGGSNGPAISRSSRDSTDNGEPRVELVTEERAIHAITPPPPYELNFPDSPAMAAYSYSARVSSLSNQHSAQFRSLDRRKEDLENQDGYTDETSDDPDEKDSRYGHFSDSYRSQSSDYSFHSPKESEKRIAYPFPHDRPGGPHKPLISFVKNDWRQPLRGKSPLPDEDDICPAGWSEILCSRACKRWLILYMLLVMAIWIWWFNYYGPRYVEDSFVRESLTARINSKDGHFGMNKRVSFVGLTHMRQLDRKLVPGSEAKGAKKRRLVIVGDIHGCYDELNSLLNRVGFDPERDHLIATGDSVSKGPKSGAVLDALILNNASSVRGNHEDKIIHAVRDHNAPSHQKYISEASPSASSGPVTLKQGARANLELAASLKEDQVRYMSSFPLILSLGPIPGMGNVSVVHGGLTPGVPLSRQDPVSVMTMRSIDLRNHIPSPRHAPLQGVEKPNIGDLDARSRLAIKPWTVLWNAWQEMQPKNQRETVIYGHDSKRGIVQDSWSIGLDGACVYGGKLAALVIEEATWGDIRKEIITVQCKDYMSQKVLRPLGEN